MTVISASSPSLADWRSDIGTFRVAILAGGNSDETLARAEPFRLALVEKLGLPVEFVPSRSYLAMVRSNSGTPVEYAVLTSSAFAAIRNMCQCMEPLATARASDGSSGFRQVVLALPGGPSNLRDLAGKTLGVIANAATGGVTIAVGELAAAGLEDGVDGFSIRRFDDGPSAVAAFRAGEIDALLGWEYSGGHTMQKPAGTIRLLLSDLQEDPGYAKIWQSSEIPFRVHAVRTNLPAAAKIELRDMLSGLFDGDPVAYDSIEPVYGGGFFVARPSQFDAISQILQAEGVVANRPEEGTAAIGSGSPPVGSDSVNSADSDRPTPAVDN